MLQLTRSPKARGSIAPRHSRALSCFIPATRCAGDALLHPGQRPFFHITQEADSRDMMSCLSSAADRIIASPKRFSATQIPLAYYSLFLTYCMSLSTILLLYSESWSLCATNISYLRTLHHHHHHHRVQTSHWRTGIGWRWEG
jgi:hypothetical protein